MRYNNNKNFNAKPSSWNRTLVLTLVPFLLIACQTPNLLESWPDDLPPRTVFVDGFYHKRDIESTDSQRLNAHLGWIVKFYRGTLLYPQGWNRVSELFLADIKDQATRDELKRRVYKLGIEIANEWAQDNNIRLINNQNMIVWGNGLKAATARMQHRQFIEQVEVDVKLLLAEKLHSSQIKFERYYPPDANNDDDNFDNF